MTAAVDRLLARIPHASWFAALGEPLQPPERAELASYINGLGLPACEAAVVADWAEAGRIASDPGWDRAWWDAEEGLRAALMVQADAAHGTRAVMDRLSAVAQAAHDATIGPAAMAAARSGIADQALVRAAAGAATQSCYQSALAFLAGIPDAAHPFHAKLQLFLGGRWPLGIVRGSAYIF